MPWGSHEREPSMDNAVFTEYDAANVLALPLHRWEKRARYRLADGWSGELRRLVYSNGIEHGFATETAETVLELGPMLRRALFEGVRSLMAGDDPEFEAYVVALAVGDHEAILRLEQEATEDEQP